MESNLIAHSMRGTDVNFQYRGITALAAVKKCLIMFFFTVLRGLGTMDRRAIADDAWIRNVALEECL